MTTLTRIADDGQAVIEVDPEKVLSRIDPMIYGGFTEHMGRCIYGGIYDPSSPLADGNGFRTDVLAALRELNLPVVRYPGGNFVATYHWADGIGPRDQRPARPELAWLGTETNAFGTDEFMRWLDALSAGREDGRRVEPYLCLNMGTGTLDEALGWVEYCNGTRDTYWANRRRANGHPEPYRVKYWALGNEVYGDWQVGQMGRDEYARTAVQWAKALKLLDPDIVLVSCGWDGISEWDFHVLKECVSWVDMHSIHWYTTADEHLPNVTAPLAAERSIQTAASLIDIAYVSSPLSKTTPPRPRPKICFDEWNVWDPARAVGSAGAEERYTLSDALAVGVWLNVFVRQSARLGMCNLAQSVNVISPLMTHAGGVVRQATWWPLLLFSRFVHGAAVAAHVWCPAGGGYAGPTRPEWLQETLGPDGAAWLDVSASLDAGGTATLVVVNIHPERDFAAELRGPKGNVQGYRVTGESLDAANVVGRAEEVGLAEFRWEASEKQHTFPKHSLTMLRWETR